jgi:acyl-CoA thioester hydrolase
VTEVSGGGNADHHRYPVRVYYEDTDAGGIVYHSRYLNFAERARTELLRNAGIEQARLAREHGLAFAVRTCEVDFRRPARLDDLLEVRSQLLALRGASIEACQAIWREESRLVTLSLRVASVSVEDGRPARIPAELRQVLAAYVQPFTED